MIPTRIRVVAVAVALLAGGAEAATGDTLRFALPGWVELELVEVDGTSALPIRNFYTGTHTDELERIQMPRYWIGKFEVMQKQYQAVMGDNPSSVVNERMPVTDVEWIDAVRFCDSLNRACVGGEIPTGYRFDLPTVVEWAHAFRGACESVYACAGSSDGEAVAWCATRNANGELVPSSLHLVGVKEPNQVGVYDMSGNVAEYVFLGDFRGANVRMGGDYRSPVESCGLGTVAWGAKHERSRSVGFRVALVPEAVTDPNGTSSALCTKGKTLLVAGYADFAAEYLRQAAKLDGFAESDRERAKQALRQAEAGKNTKLEDWSGLMKTISEKVVAAGYDPGDALECWNAGSKVSVERRGAQAESYFRHRIYGRRTAVRDLPTNVAARVASDLSLCVQAIACDFTGDGLLDLVVNLPDSTDADGECYGFFRRIRSGGYELVGEPVRNVGMCAICGIDGKVDFVVLFKRGEAAVCPSLIEYQETADRRGFRVAWLSDGPIVMQDREKWYVYGKIPFLSETPERDVKQLMSLGRYVRPLFWPWP